MYTEVSGFETIQDKIEQFNIPTELSFKIVDGKWELYEQDPQIGEVCYCKDTGQIFCYIENDGSGWIEISAPAEDNNMNLYEMNQNMVKNLPELEITEKELNMINQLHNIHQNQYYMLLCNDLKYYTILKVSNSWAIMPTMCDTLGLTVVDCLKNVGTIKSIDFVEDNSAIEIWVNVKEEDVDEIFVMYLFPYNEGVVEFRG